jgi:hypothetical protein
MIEIIKQDGGGGGGIESLNGLTATDQFLAVGTSGTDFAISSSVDTSTFNLPTASALNRGALSAANWTTFNGKQDALVSGTNIKTINSTSILGSGNLVVAAAPSGVSGAVQFSDGSALSSDATNFFWDNANDRLGLGINAPLGILHLKSAAATTRMVIDGDTSQNKIITYRTNGLQRFGLYTDNTPESGTNVGSDFRLRSYNDAGTLLTTPLFVKRSTGNVGINTTTDAGFKLDVNGTARIVGTIEASNLSGTNTGDNATNSQYSGLDATKTNKLIVANRQTASYTLVIGDADKLVEMNVATANNLTIPLDSTVAYSVGTQILISQYGAGQTTVVATVGVTVRSSGGKLKLNAQYSGATLIKIATNEWYLFGDIAA